MTGERKESRRCVTWRQIHVERKGEPGVVSVKLGGLLPGCACETAAARVAEKRKKEEKKEPEKNRLSQFFEAIKVQLDVNVGVAEIRRGHIGRNEHGHDDAKIREDAVDAAGPRAHRHDSRKPRLDKPKCELKKSFFLGRSPKKRHCQDERRLDSAL